jgi:hypothetical protein
MSPRKNDTATLVSADAAYTLIPILNAQLTSMAHAAMWPAHIVEALFVDYQEDDLIVDYPDSLGDEVDDLEYGSTTTLPNPVIRPFVARCDAIIKHVLGSQTVDEILVLEDVFNG